MASNEDISQDPEIRAIGAVVAALRDLDTATQQNVVDYVVRRFKLHAASSSERHSEEPPERRREPNGEIPREFDLEPPPKEEDGLAGISPVARRWMVRSGLTADALSELFSLGVDEIDLVAKKVPGRTKKERMKNVFLLRGAAAYLGTGAARVTHDQIKETCIHYDAFDSNNFAAYLKSLSAEVSGSKESGYTITAKGLNDATKLIQEMLEAGGK